MDKTCSQILFYFYIRSYSPVTKLIKFAAYLSDTTPNQAYSYMLPQAIYKILIHSYPTTIYIYLFACVSNISHEFSYNFCCRAFVDFVLCNCCQFMCCHCICLVLLFLQNLLSSDKSYNFTNIKIQ